MSKMQNKQRPASGKVLGLGRGWVVWGAPLLGLVLVAWLVYFPIPFGGAGRHGRSFQVQGGETRPVLDGFQFGATNVRRAYMAAAQHPDTLDQVYCYCKCDRPPFNHKSLLSCFTDYHGSS